ncbi:rhodanese-like domain-containing protein [Corynebacteriales bacterium D3-21]|uniref:Rhodanese-like domain-containing protein n=1 Tax=Speluncibacter jeojiensis TaxID=2710754 RepID=A0A9X4REV6_9ACTN|nr:rhodanese-like domain-containing protein [Rhodococcus sp. D2-41]MDG3016219.1 rhodanese-like domain-containing protein [Corynebacteriales bacterium D3-21]
MDGYAGDLTPEQSWELLRTDPTAVLVDVRTDAEWRYVGVPDLASLGRRTLFAEWVSYPAGQANSRFVEQLREQGVTADHPVVFLCRSGQRSIAAARAATAAGMGPSYNVLEGFEGGLDGQGHRGSTGWRARGLPWQQS